MLRRHSHGLADLIDEEWGFVVLKNEQEGVAVAVKADIEIAQAGGKVSQEPHTLSKARFDSGACNQEALHAGDNKLVPVLLPNNCGEDD